MNIHPRLIKILLCLIVITDLSIGNSQIKKQIQAAAQFKISYSEKLDAATLLDAISDNQIFNAPWKELRDFWLDKISKDSLVQTAFNRWQGRGIQLAYLLSAIPENDLEGTLKRFDDPDPMFTLIRKNLDEPAYESIFADFKKNYREVKLLFTFFMKNGFADMRIKKYQAVLDSTKRNLKSSLGKINVDEFVTYLETFSGEKVPKRKLNIYVLAFSKPLSFQLSGFAIGWASETENWAWLLAHEFMHKFNPNKKNLNYLEQLAKNDAFYKDSFDRIYNEYNEGKEEEFVEAASRYIISKLSLESKVRTLRSMKFLYYSNKTNKGGVPLATILLNELFNTKIHLEKFNYNNFISSCFESGKIVEGKIEELYKQSIKPVSGMVGMTIVSHENGAKIERIFPGFPAEKAGLSPGNIITEVNSISLKGKSREQILDLLAGESGEVIKIAFLHSNVINTVDITLR